MPAGEHWVIPASYLPLNVPVIKAGKKRQVKAGREAFGWVQPLCAVAVELSNALGVLQGKELKAVWATAMPGLSYTNPGLDFWSCCHRLALWRISLWLLATPHMQGTQPLSYIGREVQGGGLMLVLNPLWYCLHGVKEAPCLSGMCKSVCLPVCWHSEAVGHSALQLVTTLCARYSLRQNEVEGKGKWVWTAEPWPRTWRHCGEKI